jgi:hypothetical protein
LRVRKEVGRREGGLRQEEGYKECWDASVRGSKTRHFQERNGDICQTCPRNFEGFDIGERRKEKNELDMRRDGEKARRSHRVAKKINLRDSKSEPFQIDVKTVSKQDGKDLV